MPNSVLAVLLAVSLPAKINAATVTTATITSTTTATPVAIPEATAKQDPKLSAQVDRTVVIALEFAQATEVTKHLSRVLKLPRSGADLVAIPHPGSNSVLLRGTAKHIAAAKDLIARADVQPAFQKKGSMTQFVIIEHGAAVEIADTLKRFLKTKYSDDLRIEAHAANNMVLLRGTKARLIDSLDLIAQLDRKPTTTQVAPRFVFLEHTKAGEVAATLNRFLDLGKQTGPNRGFFIDANKPRNAVILRGNSQQVSEALDLIARLDIQTPSKKGRTRRTVVLKHAEAKDMADTLRRFAGPATDHGIDVGYSTKQNALLIQGQEDKLQQVLKLIEKLDTTPAKEPGAENAK